VRGVGWRATKLREPELEIYNKIKISRKLNRLKVLIGAHRAFPIFTPDFFCKIRKPSHEVAPTTLATFKLAVNVRLAVTYLPYRTPFYPLYLDTLFSI